MHPRRRRRVDRGRSPSSEAIARVCAEAFGSRRSLSMIWSRSLCVPRMARRRTCETADCRPDVKWGCALRVVKRSPLFVRVSCQRSSEHPLGGLGRIGGFAVISRRRQSHAPSYTVSKNRVSSGFFMFRNSLNAHFTPYFTASKNIFTFFSLSQNVRCGMPKSSHVWYFKTASRTSA